VNHRHRIIVISGVFLATVLLAVFMIWPSAAPLPDSNTNEIAENAAPPGEPAPTPEAPGRPVVETKPAITEADQQALQHYKDMNRYPPSTRRVSRESHDLLNPGMRHENRQRLINDPDDPDPTWRALFTADRYFVNGDEPALISLEIWHGPEPIAPRQVEMVAEARDDSGELYRMKLAPRRMAGGASVRFEPDKAWPDYAGPVRVSAKFSAAGLMEQTGSLDFYFTGSDVIPAEFTGEIGDRLAQGDLVFDVGLRVRKAGRYRVEAVLFDALGEPFGWARFDDTLVEGDQAVSLRYDGLLFHDTGATAPYQVTELHGYRMNPSSRAGREQIPPVEINYLSGSNYDLDQFRATARLSPRQERMLKMYEDAINRGVRLTQPQEDGPTP
jgi:hypothetical protein